MGMVICVGLGLLCPLRPPIPTLSIFSFFLYSPVLVASSVLKCALSPYPCSGQASLSAPFLHLRSNLKPFIFSNGWLSISSLQRAESATHRVVRPKALVLMRRFGHVCANQSQVTVGLCYLFPGQEHVWALLSLLHP